MTKQNALPKPPQDDPAPTPEYVREQLLGSQDRRGPALRSTFLQQYGNARAPGPLHHFVRERRLFALQLYLLHVCVARKQPWNAAYSASTWALALNRTSKSAEGTVSRNWAWLRDRGLIESKRDHRRLDVTRLSEDGSRTNYTRPTRGFFILPLDFFRDEWHTKLTLPGTAVLLIGLHLSRKGPWFELRTEVQSKWYGVSPDVLVDGLDELRDLGLLESNRRAVRDLKARYGMTQVNNYLLRGPFAHPEAS